MFIVGVLFLRIVTSSLQASYKPLLKQIVEEIFHPDHTEPTDIEHMSSGLTDLLKTGFSMFMKVGIIVKNV